MKVNKIMNLPSETVSGREDEGLADEHTATVMEESDHSQGRLPRPRPPGCFCTPDNTGGGGRTPHTVPG